MHALRGRRIALLETRMRDEASALVRNLGGIPCPVSAVREVVQPAQIGRFIDELAAGRFSLVVFLTGAGVSALLQEADRVGRLQDTLIALRRTTVACRGPKPVSALRAHQVPVHVSAAEPCTTRELLDALITIDLEGQHVALVHYGEPSRSLAGSLRERGARLEELSLYELRLPDDLGPLRALVRDLIAGHLDAIAFTNEVQGRHLFEVAASLGARDDLVQALNADIVVAAVGPVCADSLHRYGVTPDVIPARPQMGSMMAALADYFELTEGLNDAG